MKVHETKVARKKKQKNACQSFNFGLLATLHETVNPVSLTPTFDPLFEYKTGN